MDIISTIIPAVEHYFDQQSCGHDLFHALRVVSLATRIQEAEGGDPEVIRIAALVHDLYRPWEKVTGKSHFGEEALSMLEDFLSPFISSTDMLRKIIEVVRFHDLYDWSDPQQKTIELQVVQDADNLDAIGAIGIARVFAFGGSHGRVIYDPKETLEFTDDFVDSLERQTSSIAHFYEKLLKLRDHMNTTTGRKFAEKRHAFVEEFLSQFLLEWQGTEMVSR